MSRLPDSFVDDLLAKTDLVALIGEQVALKKAGKEFQGRCPFHDEKSASFTVSPAKGFYHCFGCGAHGTALKWLMEKQSMSFRQAAEALARRVGMTLPADPAPGQHPRRDDNAQLLAACHRASEYFRQQLTGDLAAQEYLVARGIDAATAARFGIGFAPNLWDGLRIALGGSFSRDVLLRAGLLSQADNGHAYDKFRNRIIFPILDRRGRTIAFGGRAIAPGTSPKYLNSPETALFQKGHELYGLSHVVQQHPAGAPELIVVEGYTDVVALAQAGITHAVATLGTAVTPEHVEAIFATTEDVLFCFDGDSAGRRAAWRALEAVLPAMQDGRLVSFLFLPDGHDPDSLVRAEGAEGFQRRAAEAVPLSEFLFAELAKSVDLASIEGRARLAKRAVPLIEQIPTGVFRELMRARLSELAGAPVQAPTPASVPGLASRTPIRQAIALLLRSPQLAAQLPVSLAFRRVNRPGAALLAELLEFAQLNPDADTAAMLAHVEGREEAEHLRKLVGAELPDNLVAQLADLRGALGRLDKYARRRRIELLTNQDELTPQETAELRDLLRFDRDARLRKPPAMPAQATVTRH